MVAPLDFDTPVLVMKVLMDSGVYPRLRSPASVGILGSSHPSTTPSSTSARSLRLLVTTLVISMRENSICLGGVGNSPTCSIHQLYRGL